MNKFDNRIQRTDPNKPGYIGELEHLQNIARSDAAALIVAHGTAKSALKALMTMPLAEAPLLGQKAVTGSLFEPAGYAVQKASRINKTEQERIRKIRLMIRALLREMG